MKMGWLVQASQKARAQSPPVEKFEGETGRERMELSATLCWVDERKENLKEEEEEEEREEDKSGKRESGQEEEEEEEGMTW